MNSSIHSQMLVEIVAAGELIDKYTARKMLRVNVCISSEATDVSKCLKTPIHCCKFEDLCCTGVQKI